MKPSQYLVTIAGNRALADEGLFYPLLTEHQLVLLEQVSVGGDESLTVVDRAVLDTLLRAQLIEKREG